MSQPVVKWVLIPVGFFFSLVLFVYVGFPAGELKEPIQRQIQERVSPLLKVQNPTVEIESVSLWRLTGVSLRNVVVSGGDTTWQFERLNFRIGLFAVLKAFKNSTFNKTALVEELECNPCAFSAKLYGGSLNGSVSVTKEGNWFGFDLDIDEIDLEKFSKGSQLPLHGQFQLASHLDLRNPETEGNGLVHLSIRDWAIDEGKLDWSFAGLLRGFSLPSARLGNLTLEMPVAEGKGKVQKFELKGGEIEAEAGLEMNLNKNLMRSLLSGSGWLKPADAFLAKSPALQSLLEISPQIRQSKDEEGRYAFYLRGTLQSLNFGFGK